MKIGKRLRELRQSKKMKLIELAEKSGVQIATLSRMENGRMTGTLESHMKIARALGVDVTYLYRGIETDEEALAEEQVRTRDVFVHSQKASFEILTQNVLSKNMMPVLLALQPGGQTTKEQTGTGVEKFIYVLDGKVTVQIEQQTYQLKKGNSLYFYASLPHQMTNAGKTVARIISVVSPVAL